MTTHDENIAATEQLALPEFYTLTVGTNIYRYTTFATDLTFIGHTYEAAALKRGGLTFDSNMGAIKLTLAAVLTTQLKAHIANTPTDRTKLVVHQAVEQNLGEYIVFFEGYLSGLSFDGLKADMQFEAKSLILENHIPDFVHQSRCNHQLFNSDCGLDAYAWAVETAVIVTGKVLFSEDFGLYADGYFTMGEVVYGTDARMVTNHIGNNITLHVAFDSRVASGTIVTAYPGCDGSADTCKNKFDNWDRRTGFDLIPNKNPVVWGL